mmetsp:Transcript_12781/g.30077  ORF Transcript_12781/g.30077 Transcript_12781/m.30077 type:complete len:225 (+) Transcript_12781:477-1151(+)
MSLYKLTALEIKKLRPVNWATSFSPRASHLPVAARASGMGRTSSTRASTWASRAPSRADCAKAYETLNLASGSRASGRRMKLAPVRAKEMEVGVSCPKFGEKRGPSPEAGPPGINPLAAGGGASALPKIIRSTSASSSVSMLVAKVSTSTSSDVASVSVKPHSTAPPYGKKKATGLSMNSSRSTRVPSSRGEYPLPTTATSPMMIALDLNASTNASVSYSSAKQ